MQNIFFELTLVVIGAGVIAYLTHFFKQPSIIGYILAGLLIGPIGIYKMHHGEILHGLSEIGITLLLFMVGLDLNIGQLKRIGKAAIYAGLGQVIFTCLIGFGIIKFLGIASLPAWYIAIALTFSSTIIVVKLLNEKKHLQSLYGKLAVGIFLIQDIAAIFILIFLAGLTGSNSEGNILGAGITAAVVLTIAKAFMAGVLVIWLSRYVLPKIISTIEKNDELILVFSLAWSLGLAAIFSLPQIGFNAAIGGFVAGLSLANSGIHHQISGRIKSLRDFFIIIFFIVLGSNLILNDFASIILPVIVLSLFVLIGNPFIVMTVLGLMGYKPRVSFMTGVTVAQISEFSLILMALGLASGHVEEKHVSIVTFVGIITIALSSYGILYTDKLYKMLHKYLAVFDFRPGKASSKDEPPMSDHFILVGAHRLGSQIITLLGQKTDNLMIVDFNPDVVHYYQKLGYSAVLGDITDLYMHEVANTEKAKMIISTIPDLKDTLSLLEAVGKFKKRIRTIVAASDHTEARALYAAGADYVILPHFIGSMHLATIIEADYSLKDLKKLKQDQLDSLEKSLGYGT